MLGTCSACLSKPFESVVAGRMLTNVCRHFFLGVHTCAFNKHINVFSYTDIRFNMGALKREMNCSPTAPCSRMLVHVPCDL